MRNTSVIGAIAFLFLIISCQDKRNVSSTLEQKTRPVACSFHKETESIFREILKDSMVLDMLKYGAARGYNNLKLEGDIFHTERRSYKVDTMQIDIIKTVPNNKDFILDIEKIDCTSGKFVLTTNSYSTFIIEGEIRKINDLWKVKSSSYIEIN